MKHIKTLGRRFTAIAALVFMVAAILPGTTRVGAEGTSQFNEAQNLQSGTVVFADVLHAGETINISSCRNLAISMWNSNGTPSNTADDIPLLNTEAFTANAACNAPLPNPITNPFKYAPTAPGTYRIEFTAAAPIERYDFSVTANVSTNPDPGAGNGRIWSFDWKFLTNSFAQSAATDADLYVLVPAPNPAESFVYKLDLNNFSGNGYGISANSLGLNAPYSGLSARQASSSVSKEFPLYIGYPAVAGSANSAVPTISAASFIDNANEDNIFSPNATPGVQDTGWFKFTSNVSNANYAVTIDTNKDGVYGTGDRLLLGKAQPGANTVAWDGKYPDGSPVGPGVYTAQIQIRVGEYHFIAGDVETSGGTTDNGATWTNGLTIYKATGPSTIENTTVYWDDKTILGSEDYPTANVPSGVMSGSLADADGDGRADGFHTWGEFDPDGVGNINNIDTYVYGPADAEIVSIAVAGNEAGDADGMAANIEVGAPNAGDGNGDGTVDFLQNLVTSLPNPEADDAFNTVTSSGCSNLSNVAVYAEEQLGATDASFEYPLGLFHFKVNCLAPGASTNVTVYYGSVYDTADWTPRKFINGTYEDIPGAVFGVATVGGKQVTTLTYTLKDGGPLDADGTANGVIDDPVGPGVKGASVVSAIGAPNTGYAQDNGITTFGLLFAGSMVGVIAVLYGKDRKKPTATK